MATGFGPIFRERGRSGLSQSGGYIQEEFISKLRWPYAGKIYQEMSNNDPVITAVLFCCRMLLRQVRWKVVPASDTSSDVECAQFVESCMLDMSETWADFIDELTSYFTYGFSYHEIVYKRRLGSQGHVGKSRYNDGRIGWKKIPGRKQTTLSGWEFAEDGGLRGAWQISAGKRIFLPIEKCLLFRTSAANGNPEGISFLRGAYRPWYFKKHIEEVEGIGIERDLAGLPVIISPEGMDLDNKEDPKAVAARNAAISLVTSIRRDRNDGVVLSHGWDLKLLSTGGSRQFDTNAIINRYDQRIAITLLADIIMLGADKVGSFALAKVKQSLLANALDAQLKSICEVLNYFAIPRLISLNSFPSITGMPRFECDSVVAPDLNELGNFISKLSGADMPLFPDESLENYLRSVARLPEIDDQARQQIMAAKTESPKKGTEGGTSSTTGTPTKTPGNLFDGEEMQLYTYTGLSARPAGPGVTSEKGGEEDGI